jgi:hypothetical protein
LGVGLEIGHDAQDHGLLGRDLDRLAHQRHGATLSLRDAAFAQR